MTDLHDDHLDLVISRLSRAQERAVRQGYIKMDRGYWALRHALIEKELFTVANRRTVLSVFGKAVQARLLSQGAAEH